MAQTQTAAATDRQSQPAAPAAPPERQVAYSAAESARPAAFDTAVDFLERVFVRANRNQYSAQIKDWIDPDVTEPKYARVRDSVISDVLQESAVYKEGLAAKRKYYEKQVTRFVPVVEAAARNWALRNLRGQTQRLFSLLTTTKPRVKDLHKAALAVVNTVYATRVVKIQGRSYAVNTFVLPTMTGDEAREATGESRTGGTVDTRLRRMFYTFTLRSGPVPTKGVKPTASEIEAYKILLTLMAHPRGVQIVDEFRKSSEAGWNFTSGLMSDTFTANVKLQSDLVTDRTLVWRFPPAISAGVASLGLNNRAGITQFALAWGASRKGKLDEALEIAGNSLFVLDLVGGPLGGAVSGILDFILAAIGTAISFLRDVEQDQAAAATAFAERTERLSQGSNKVGTVLQGLAAIAAGLAVPGSLPKITRFRTKQVVRFPELKPLAHQSGPGPRLGVRGTENDVAQAANRAVAGDARGIVAREVDGKSELATGRPRRNQRAEIDRPRELDKANDLERPDGPRNRERGLSNTPGVVKPSPLILRQSLKSSVPELPILAKQLDSKNYSLDQVTAFFRRHRDEYPTEIRKKIDALPVSKPGWAHLQDIDGSIKQLHTDRANRMAGLGNAERKPFIKSVKGTESNEGARLAKVITDDKSLTLVGQYAGGTVEFDCVQFVESRIVEVKLSLRWTVGNSERWVPPEEILVQIRKQLQFVDEWKKWSELKWVIADERSFYLVLGILEKGVGGRHLEPELASRLKVELFR